MKDGGMITKNFEDVLVTFNAIFLILAVLNLLLYGCFWGLQKYRRSICYRERCYKRIERMRKHLENEIITQEEFEKNKSDILRYVLDKD